MRPKTRFLAGPVLATLLTVPTLFAPAAKVASQSAPASPTQIAPAVSPSSSTNIAATKPSVPLPNAFNPDTLDGLTRHALAQEKIGFYGVLVPPGYYAQENRSKRYKVVLILHSSVSGEAWQGEIANYLGREDVIYVVPRAPYVNEPAVLQEHRLGYTAWPTYPAEWGDRKGDAFPREEIDALDERGQYERWILRCLADARKRYRTQGSRVVVFGHSQGATFAHYLAVRHPQLVQAYFAHAGFYAPTLATYPPARTAQALKRGNVHPFVAHQEADWRVPVAEARALITAFQTGRTCTTSVSWLGSCRRRSRFADGQGTAGEQREGDSMTVELRRARRTNELGLSGHHG